MKLIHGSSQVIDNNNKFKLFDYKMNNEKKAEGAINNGNDEYGPGIYTLPGDNNSFATSLKVASSYADGGYIYKINIDMDGIDTIDKLSADEIEVDEWVKIINRFIELRYEQEGFKPNEMESKLHEFDIESKLADGNLSTTDIESVLSDFDYDFDIEIDDYDQDDGYQLINDIIEEYKMNNDPCGRLYDDGGSEAIASHCVNSSDNLWQTITKVWDSIAVDSTGLGYETYNETFQKSVFDVIGHDKGLILAHGNEHGVVVVFDTSKIEIEKVIDLSIERNDDLSL